MNLGSKILCLLVIACGAPASASVVFRGEAIDAAASVTRAIESMRSSGEDFRVPWSGREVVLELIEPQSSGPARSWTASTDENGHFDVDTGLDRLPSGARFVAHADDEAGSSLYSPFLVPSDERQGVHLYALTEDPTDVQARIEVAYTVDGTQDPPRLRVQVTAQLMNRASTMYVGRRGGGGWREVCRVPIPEGAKIERTSSPDPGSPGWRPSVDGRWLLIDTPIPGILDADRLGFTSQGAGRGWEVVYTLPGRQVLAQAYPLPFEMEPQGFAVWCPTKDLAVESPHLEARSERMQADPVTGEQRTFDVVFSNRPLAADDPVLVALSIDNLVVRQVSRSALRWVGGFVLVVLLAVLGGLVFGRRAPAPELLFGHLSGEEVLDRITDLDRRFERGDLREPDYRRYREALLELASEELEGLGPAASAAAASADAPAREAPGLPPAALEVVAQIHAIDRSGATDPATIAQRTQLLEALLKALTREMEPAEAGREKRGG